MKYRYRIPYWYNNSSHPVRGAWIEIEIDINGPNGI